MHMYKVEGLNLFHSQFIFKYQKQARKLISGATITIKNRCILYNIFMTTTPNSKISPQTLEDVKSKYRQDLPRDPLPEKRPQFYNGVRVRMPEDYNFSNEGKIKQYTGVNWKSYKKDYRLRTDAVWQKQQLKDWFRLFNKCFYFNTVAGRYEFIEPDDIYTMILEPWQYENDDVEIWNGFTRTGRAFNFQTGLGPKQRIETTVNSNYAMSDYKYICAARFQNWLRCDLKNYEERNKYDRNPIPANYKTYPCFRQYYQATYACADDYMRRGLELAYTRRAKHWNHEQFSNVRLRMQPTVWDTPKLPERTTYTY